VHRRLDGGRSGGTATTIGEIVETIAEAVPESAGAITYEETPLPFPSGLDSSSFVELVGEKPGDSARRRRARDRASLP
jgi:hypothetical protein